MMYYRNRNDIDEKEDHKELFDYGFIPLKLDPKERRKVKRTPRPQLFITIRCGSGTLRVDTLTSDPFVTVIIDGVEVGKTDVLKFKGKNPKWTTGNFIVADVDITKPLIMTLEINDGGNINDRIKPMGAVEVGYVRKKLSNDRGGYFDRKEFTDKVVHPDDMGKPYTQRRGLAAGTLTYEIEHIDLFNDKLLEEEYEKRREQNSE
jgi:Ca2+-dependent lipid-binding protein